MTTAVIFNPTTNEEYFTTPCFRTRAEAWACATGFILALRLPSFSGHPICTDPVSVGEDVHCESTAQEVHAGVPA